LTTISVTNITQHRMLHDMFYNEIIVDWSVF
jgi:hypothetical protein